MKKALPARRKRVSGSSAQPSVYRNYTRYRTSLTQNAARDENIFLAPGYPLGRLRIVIWSAGLAAIATVNAARASSSERKIAAALEGRYAPRFSVARVNTRGEGDLVAASS